MLSCSLKFSSKFSNLVAGMTMEWWGGRATASLRIPRLLGLNFLVQIYLTKILYRMPRYDSRDSRLRLLFVTEWLLASMCATSRGWVLILYCKGTPPWPVFLILRYFWALLHSSPDHFVRIWRAAANRLTNRLTNRTDQ